MSSEPRRILIVEDDPALARLIEAGLKQAGFVVGVATNGREAMLIMEQECPEIVITDWEMPHVDGPTLCEWIRSIEWPHYVYIMMLTIRDSSTDVAEGFRAGADDYVPKPIDRASLLARLRAAERVLELESRLSLLAKVDPLTGLANRVTFHDHLQAEWQRSKRHSFPISCAMVDIDFFKRINDTYGHHVGDNVICAVAGILRANVRQSDIVCRYGGEEFCILLPETDEPNALIWANRFRNKLRSTEVETTAGKLKITVSMGVAQSLLDTTTPEQLVDLADQSLYVAKRSGRDRAVGYQSIHQNGDLDPTTTGAGAIFRNLKAAQVMTPVVAGLNQNETVGAATQFFLKSRVSFAPVVTPEEQLVGVLSERDVMAIMLFPDWHERRVREVMKTNVVSAEEDTSALQIYEFLCRVSIRAVVIVRNGKPTGIISRGSLLQWFANAVSTLGGQGFEREISANINDSTPVDLLRKALPNARERIMVASEVMAREANELHETFKKNRDQDLLPVVIGGATRMQEIIGDLLAYSRFASTQEKDLERGTECGIVNLLTSIPESIEISTGSN